MYCFILTKFFSSYDIIHYFFNIALYVSNNSSSWTEDWHQCSPRTSTFLRGGSSPFQSNFRAQNADVEAQLFSRIRGLEAQLAHGLPPQLNPGEYERLVRERKVLWTLTREGYGAFRLMVLLVNYTRGLFMLCADWTCFVDKARSVARFGRSRGPIPLTPKSSFYSNPDSTPHPACTTTTHYPLPPPVYNLDKVPWN